MFDELTAEGRVWIYTSNRVLNDEEQKDIHSKLNDFLGQWAAHGKSLQADFKIFYNQVMVLAVNENFEEATGCSIDSSVQIFRELDTTYNIDLFNRLNLAFVIEEQIRIVQLAELNTAYQAGLIKADSILLDNSLYQLSKFRASWKVPLNQSWAQHKIKQLA